MNETIIGKIEKLVAGGDGIIRDAEGAVFVPLVAPGEEVEVVVVSKKGKVRFARVKKIVVPSPDRVAPECPYFGECGGCQWQHISYDAQLACKTAIVAESLSWIGKISTNVKKILPSPKQYGYRSRVRLHVKKGKPGYFSTGKEKFVPIEKCPIANVAVNRGISMFSELPRKHDADEVELMDSGGGVVAVVPGKSGVARFGVRDSEWVALDDRGVGFTQINSGQNANLRIIIREIIQKMKPASVVELFAGGGNLTGEIAASSGSVVAVDSDPDAIEHATQKNPGAKNIRFVRADSATFVSDAAKNGDKPSAIVLDPPRTGAKECLKGMLALEPKHIVYVSCDPATLARDLKELATKYAVKSVAPLDMFPQTAHIETVSILERI